MIIFDCHWLIVVYVFIGRRCSSGPSSARSTPNHHHQQHQPQQLQHRWNNVSPKVFLANSSTVSLPASAVLGMRGRSATPGDVCASSPVDSVAHRRSHSVGASRNNNSSSSSNLLLHKAINNSLEALAACEEQLEQRRRQVAVYTCLHCHPLTVVPLELWRFLLDEPTCSASADIVTRNRITWAHLTVEDSGKEPPTRILEESKTIPETRPFPRVIRYFWWFNWFLSHHTWSLDSGGCLQLGQGGRERGEGAVGSELLRKCS